MERAAPRVLEVEPTEAGLRLDAFLVARGICASATAARRFLTTTAVHVAGRTARKGQQLAAGDRVELPAATDAPAVVPEPELALTIIYEDASLLALDKPAGIPSHPLLPGERGTLAGALVARYPECAHASVDPREGGLAHRLDTGTSGVIVAGRTSEAYTGLRRALVAGGSKKCYLAEVVGVPAGGPGVIVVDVAIGRLGRRGARVVLGGGRGALPARTEIFVRERRGGTTLVEARLAAGRAHQVRAHLAHIGSPIVGDTLYGAPLEERAPGGFRLHAWRLELRHPITGAALAFESPPPDWARQRR